MSHDCYQSARLTLDDGPDRTTALFELSAQPPQRVVDWSERAIQHSQLNVHTQSVHLYTALGQTLSASPVLCSTMSISLHSRHRHLPLLSICFFLLRLLLLIAWPNVAEAAVYSPQLPFPSTVCVDVDCGVTASARLDSLRSIATVPVKGWNSYDSWLWRVNETTVLAHIDFIADNLLQYGYYLVTIDYYWYTAKHIKATALVAQQPHGNYDISRRTSIRSLLQCSKASPTHSLYVCIDVCTCVCLLLRYLDLDESTTYMDECGRPQPDPRRFPSSKADQGFKHIATYAHQRGLLFGIHVMRGINEVAIEQNLTVCGTNSSTQDIYEPDMECNFSLENSKFYSVNLSHPAGQAFLDTLFAQYAEWGVDFIKQDCVLDGDWDYESILGAATGIDHSGRQMLLSLSGGGTDDLYHASVVAGLASMYRVTTDVWDRWLDSILPHFQTAHDLADYIGFPSGRYGWPSFSDLDMLPFGFISEEGTQSPPYHYSRLSPDERLTALTLWTMFRSPLIYGGDWTHNDSWSLDKLTNELALRITDSSINNRDILTSTTLAVWRADSASYSTDGISYASISNLADTPQRVEFAVALLRFPHQTGTSCHAVDVWAKTQVGVVEQVNVTLSAHASILWLLNDCTVAAVERPKVALVADR